MPILYKCNTALVSLKLDPEMPGVLSKFLNCENTNPGPEHKVLNNLLMSRNTMTRSVLTPMNGLSHSEDLEEFERMTKEEINRCEETKENRRN